MPIRIAEIYSSLQGEGLLTGTPSLFIRTSGCNLRCQFCDTPFTSWNPEGESQTVDSILEAVQTATDQHVVLTGGEPLLPAEVVDLTEGLHRLGRHITIETAGTLVRSVRCDLLSISPKLSNSTPGTAMAGSWSARHETARINLPVLEQLISDWSYQMKFVLSSPAQLAEIRSLLDRLPAIDPRRVLLMPEGISQEVLEQRREWLEPLCEQAGFVFCPRKHIEWYGNRRGT